MVQYIVKASNSTTSFSEIFNTLNEAKIYVRAIKKTQRVLCKDRNDYLHGCISEWVGYLEEGSIMESATQILNF